MHFNMSQGPLLTEIYRKNAAAQNHGAHFVRALRSRNACQDFTRTTLYGNLQEKCRSRKPRRRLCASVGSRNARQDFTRDTLYGNLQEKCRGPGVQKEPRTRTRALCERGQSKRTSRFHKRHFIRKFTGKMLGPRVSTLTKHRPLHVP